ncbi:unnamed protein product [Albugo candida]|uniref:ubiquitinyl hydrolase 1 n=1 Tax=Albugo candida TaxID=65357 RepID=A0A024GGW9_9STRA|nr:unnamed protein product [Albugo candida]|eukprot:CCI45590.1 unnamed protein product [Albugo candida]
MSWIDSEEAKCTTDNVVGILCNIVTRRWFSWKKLEQRHWFAIKQIEGVHYNLDSLLQEPKAFESKEEMQQFLQVLSDSHECQFFKVERSSQET